MNGSVVMFMNEGGLNFIFSVELFVKDVFLNFFINVDNEFIYGDRIWNLEVWSVINGFILVV